jgi:hypothetical protein
MDVEICGDLRLCKFCEIVPSGLGISIVYKGLMGPRPDCPRTTKTFSPVDLKTSLVRINN